ncbi:hypothetical protein [Streptomyces anthocyanicus]|uniref:hypothetical protein n=1 Tax=Streptomyces anthocyanicus TaxID=68174 RepID=UPI003870D13A|nr:hypothetical protein OH747_05665 [Streptomyces anthocyanicus]
MNATRIGTDRGPYLHASTTHTYDEAGDIDLIAVEHALNGQPVTLTQAEQIYTARLLHERGYGPTVIGRHIRADHSTVTAWRDNGWKPVTLHPKSRKKAEG